MKQPPTVTEIREKIETVRVDKYKYAMMYGFLTASSVSEICGKYKPQESNISETTMKINGQNVPAIMFLIDTMKKQIIRPCVIPLDEKYEPWAKPLLEYFLDKEGDYPFNFCMRAIQREARTVFSGDIWWRGEYISSRTGERVSADPLPFTLKSLRSLRKQNLIEYYSFNDIDLAIFGGWKETTDPLTTLKIKDILITKTRLSDESYFKKMSETYFKKLLMPIKRLSSFETESHKQMIIIEDLVDGKKDTKYDVFISYYRKTAGDYAEFLRSGLLDQQITPFMDIYDMPKIVKDLTSEWRIFRDGSILNSDKFLLIMTQGFRKSPEVIKEIKLANDNGIELIFFKDYRLPFESLKIEVGGKETDLSKVNINIFVTKEDLLRQSLLLLEK